MENNASIQERRTAALEKYHIKEIAPSILPYFMYYTDKYQMVDTGKYQVLQIPVMDGSRGLDNYFINVLTANGWTFQHNFLLSQIWMIYTQKEGGRG